ncbi:Bifunctional lysine-specific demethylase and histidyl-hydroxylase NO66 [Pseudolycoriella hygida]|uniref:Bifunctional lysine-specific demethylase and histidyl-hydroxylase n=1 Tax=Pseudolycoriella hygida TaxID=35572 RepID=A0A9Q0MS02_9DIPT|nr:Bifunctional lysine-specific demethylase and histidyl-hydroxylase NO66 [Pseudolycoriella hygida]
MRQTMQSNHSPEVSSTYSHLNANKSTESCASSPSRKKPISPKLRRSPSKLLTTPPAAENFHKRKMNSNEKSAEKMRRPNGFDSQPTNSNDTNHLYNDNNMTEDHETSQSHSSRSTDYNSMLNLTPEVGSIEEGKRLFGILMRPLQVTTFMEKHWEQQPLRVDRKCPDFYKDLLSSEVIDRMLRHNHVDFTKSIDIQFKDGNEVITPMGRALPPTIWQYYSDGCGIKIVNPQTFLPAIHSMNATLQEYFQCMIDSNVHLSSKNSDGHAPRYDDIEIFVLQIEGKKHWRIYKPAHRHNVLSREAKNVDPIGEPVLDVILRAGDLLYFPRGFIHETTTLADSHSLHLTLSMYRKQTYGDLLEILVPMALKEAINSNINLRKGLPLDIWQNMGVVNSDNYFRERDAVIAQIKDCFETVCRYVRADTTLDNAVDQMALRYQHDALPPKLTADEELRSVYGTKITSGEDGCPEYVYIELDTKIRLIRGNVVRMVMCDSGIRVYYSSENSKDHHGFEENYLEINPSDAPAIEVLIKAYPLFITPADLQLESNDKSLCVAQDLWEKGILMTDKPLV